MAVSQAPAVIDTPLSISVAGSSEEGVGGEAPGTLHIAELTPEPVSGHQRFVAVMASSLQSPPSRAHERLAVQAVISTVKASTGQQLAEQVKAAFREANRTVYQEIAVGSNADVDGVAMLTLLTNGKYATVGLVGHDRAYLARARRLTQLTRDQRVERARSRRKQDIEPRVAGSAASQSIRLLGEMDRLDSRSPAVFEITLLPEDKLALLSHGLAERLNDDTILSSLRLEASSSVATFIPPDQRSAQANLMAAVLEVASVREAMPVLPVSHLAPRAWWPLVMLLLVALAVAAGLVLLVLE